MFAGKPGQPFGRSGWTKGVCDGRDPEGGDHPPADGGDLYRKPRSGEPQGAPADACEELSLTCRRAVWDADAEGMWKGQYKGIDDWELRETEDFYGNAAA